MYLSKQTNSAFDGRGGRRCCAYKEKAGLQRSVMVAFFERYRGQEMLR